MKFLTQTQILFIGIVTGPLLFLGVVMFLQWGGPDVVTDYNHPFIYVSVIISVVAIIASNLITRFRMPAIKRKPTLKEKLDGWRILFMLRIALIEGACMFNIACLLILEFDIFLYISVALIVLQFMNLPTREKLKTDLELTEEELLATSI